jgi:hypothetical protein
MMEVRSDAMRHFFNGSRATALIWINRSGNPSKWSFPQQDQLVINAAR